MGVYNIQKEINEWNIDYSYTVGTQVVYDNMLFIAKQNVPKGINLGMGEYWERLATDEEIEEVTSDVEELNEDVSDIQSDLIKTVVEVTGNPINFTTGIKQLAQGVEVEVEPIQDLHGYDKPWVGGAGKNLINPNTFEQGILNSSGTIDVSNSWITSDYIKVSNIVTLSGYQDGTEKNCCVRFAEYDENKTFIKISTNIDISGNTYWNHSITLDADTQYVRFTVGFENRPTTIQTYFATNRIQLEIGSPATTYEPYENICPISGHTEVGILGTNGKEDTDPDYVISNDITIHFGQTVYGATLDVGRGLLVVDKIARNINDAVFGTWRVHATYNTIYVTDASTIDKAIGLKNIFGSCYSTSDATSVANIQNGEVRGHASNNNIYIRDDNFVNDANSFVTNRGNQQLCYELATPITIEVTPHQIALLDGVNNISTDGTTITLSYRNGKYLTRNELNQYDIEAGSAINYLNMLITTLTDDLPLRFKFHYDNTSQKYGFIDNDNTFIPFA